MQKKKVNSQLKSAAVFDFLTDSIFLVVAFVLGLLALYYRRHLEVDLVGIAKLLTLSTLLVVGPQLVVQIAEQKKGWRWIRLPEATGLVLTAFIIFGFIPLGASLFWIATGSFVLAIAIAKRKKAGTPNTDGKSVEWRLWWGWGLAVSIFTVYFFAAGWDANYLSLTFPEEILCGHANRDTVAHIAYATIFQVYHKFGAGIHGLTPFRYHLGSHLFYVAISNIVARPLSFAYNFGHVLITIPLLFHVVFSLHIRNRIAASQHSRLLKIIGVVLLGALIIFPFHELRNNGAFASSYISESFTFSAILFFIILAILLRFCREGKEKSETHLPRLFVLIFIPALVAFATFAKVSTGYIAMSLVGGVLIWNLATKRRNPIGLFLMSAFATCLTYWIFAGVTKKATFKWNSHFHDELPIGAMKYYLIYCSPYWFIMLIGFAALYCYKRFRPQTGHENPAEFTLIWMLGATVVALATWPILHLELIGAGYFFLALRWACMVGVCAATIQMLSVFMENKRIRNGLYAVILLFIAGASGNWSDFNRAFNHKIAENVIPSNAGVRYKQDGICLPQFVEKLNEVRSQSSLDTMVYVAPGEDGLRKWPDGNWDNLSFCENFPFIVTGESGRPMVFGMERQIEKCEFDEMNMWLGKDHRNRYSAYYQSSDFEVHPEMICSEVRRFNFKKYIQLSLDQNTKEIKSLERSCE